MFYSVNFCQKTVTCIVVSVNGTLFEAKMCTFTLESRHFIFKKCPIYIHDGANAKFSTNSHETDYSVQSREGSIHFKVDPSLFWPYNIFNFRI